MNTALYYPTIDIPDKSWLRVAALFWDEIRTIVPTSIRQPYQLEDTITLEQEGILAPLRCDLQGDVLNDLGSRMMTFMQQSGERLHQRTARPTLIHADKLSSSLRDEFQLARLHPHKMSREMQALFANATSEEANFLLVDSHFANIYMAVLAARLAREVDASPLSSDERSHEVNLAALVNEIAAPQPTNVHGALVTVATRSLNVDPETPMKDIVRFRQRRQHQLAELSATFEALMASATEFETPEQLVAAAKNVYGRMVQPALEKLKTELDDNRIASVWGGIQRTALVSVGATSLLGVATGWPTEALLGAGAFITIGDVMVQSHLGSRKIRRSSPYTYLLDVERKFHLPRHLQS